MNKLIVAFRNFAKAPKIPEVDDMMLCFNPIVMLRTSFHKSHLKKYTLVPPCA